MTIHSSESSYREKLIEHLFIGELLKLSWLNHQCGLEVSKPEVDNSGYDVIAECYGIVRHIQLKASHLASSTNSQNVHLKLAEKPSGCLVWIVFDEATLVFDHFLFYGDMAGEPLPNINDLKVGKHTKGNKEGIKAERPNIRVINKGQFKRINSIEELFYQLFCIDDTKLPMQLAEISTDNTHTEFKKLHRIENWAKRPWQKNTQLIRAFLVLEKNNSTVSRDSLITYCLDHHGGSKAEWLNNFNSMKTDLGNSHCKVFYLEGQQVFIYEEARNEIEKHFN